MGPAWRTGTDAKDEHAVNLVPGFPHSQSVLKKPDFKRRMMIVEAIPG